MSAAWTPIEYTNVVHDAPSGRWISRAEGAEIDLTAFTRLACGRRGLVVRRILDLREHTDGQGAVFDTWRFHGFVTDPDLAALDTVTADNVHRGNAIIEQIQADLKNFALAHLLSGRFAANSAWLLFAIKAFTTATATATGQRLAKATTTIRRTLVTGPNRLLGTNPDPASPTLMALGK